MKPGLMRPGDKRTDGWLPGGDGRLIVRTRGARGAVMREFAFAGMMLRGAERLLTHGTRQGMTLKATRALTRELAQVRAAGADPGYTSSNSNSSASGRTPPSGRVAASAIC